jgi:DNA-binding transcriptional regulator GbsR (MarR family)
MKVLAYDFFRFVRWPLEEKTESELGVAWEETRKAQEAAKNAQSEAIKQAKADLEHELKRAEYQRSEA